MVIVSAIGTFRKSNRSASIHAEINFNHWPCGSVETLVPWSSFVVQTDPRPCPVWFPGELRVVSCCPREHDNND